VEIFLGRKPNNFSTDITLLMWMKANQKEMTKSGSSLDGIIPLGRLRAI
jgi:hypothetical protein